MAVSILGIPAGVSLGSTYTAETGGSNRVVVFVLHVDLSQSSATITSFSMGAVSATQAVQSVGTGASGTISIWYIKEADIPTGAQTLSGTISGGSLQSSGIYCYTLQDVDQISTIAGTDSNVTSGTGSTIAFSSLVTAVDGLAIGGANLQEVTTVTWAPPTGWTEDYDGSTITMSGCFDHYATNGTTESGTFTMSASDANYRMCAVAAFSPVSGTPISFIPPTLQRLCDQFTSIMASKLNGVLQ